MRIGHLMALFVMLAGAVLTTGSQAMTLRQATEALLARQAEPDPPGEVLFREDFEDGNLERWAADSGWGLVPHPDGQGHCAQAVASAQEHEDLVLRAHISVTPGHPIAVCWRTRWVTGSAPLWLRVDFFDDQGQQGEPYARQEASRTGPNWTDNAMLVSDWFPSYTRAITIWFHHEPQAGTTSLLDAVRVVDLSGAALEMVSAEVPRATQAAEQLAADLAALPASPLADAWHPTIQRGLAAVRAQLAECAVLDPGTPEMDRALAASLATLGRLRDAVTGLREGTVTTAGVLVYRTKPITSTMILPHTTELPGKLTGEIELTVFAGEREPVSLVLWAPEALRGLMVTPASPADGESGLSPVDIDVKWVRCWYQAGTAWWGVMQDHSRKVLVPELLLNDDSLVRVDLQTQHNELKLAFPEKARYVSIDDPTPVRWGTCLPNEEFPVQDSPVLLPTDLPAGQNKQVWVTVRAPAEAAGGVYVNRLTISADGVKLGTVTLRVRVLPMELPEPRAHWNPDEPFTYSLYYWGALDPEGRGHIGLWSKSEQQMRAELQYLWDHNIVAPVMIWMARQVYGDEAWFRRGLEIMRQVGMSGRPLYFGSSDMIGNPTEPAALEELGRNVSKTIAVAREYGFTDVYFYGIDEARGDLLRSQRPAWEKVHECGGKVIVSGFEGQRETVGDLLDLFNRAGDPAAEDPEWWHQRGHRLFNYAHPQTPPENPELYRRNYGVYLWLADFDGECTYCFMDSGWNDFADDGYRAHNLAYPTVNGVVGTLAMEGLREAADDVKCLTLLSRRVAAALTSGNEAQRNAAAAARDWLVGLDPRTVDLDQMRAAAIHHILALEPDA